MTQSDNYTQTAKNNTIPNLQLASTNIVFIDPTVPDYQSLISGITLGNEVVVLDPTQDAIVQITAYLAARPPKSVQSVHIVSHGSVGSLQLGSTNLNSSNINSYASQLQKWANVLTDDADILLYGCDIASGEGSKFVQHLSKITGGDVAASTDKTGSAALGGNWNLEFHQGIIAAPLAFQSEVLQAYNYDLPVLFNGLYSQNFDTLATTGNSNSWTNDTTLLGWSLFNASGNPIISYGANNGTSTTGSFYSYGVDTSTDRALGGLGSGGTYFGSPASGSVAGWIAFSAKNTSGSTINSLNIAFNGEQWRNAGNTTAQTMVLEYGFGSSFTTVTTWTAPGLTFNWTSPVATTTGAAVDGNTTGLVANRGGTLDNLNWASDDTLWLRWVETNDTGNDHGLAIDDLVVRLTPTLNLSGGISSYTENQGWQTIFSDATVTNPAAADFNGSKLTVNFESGTNTKDIISIRNNQTAANPFTDGIIGAGIDRVTYNSGAGPVQIGTFSGGTNSNSLVVTFNSSATKAAVEALIKNIVYSNISDDPLGGDRKISFVFNDGVNNSTPVIKTISLTPENDKPVVAIPNATFNLYNGSGTPDAQGFIYQTLPYHPVASTQSGSTTTTSVSDYAGYVGKAESIPILDRNVGYSINFTAQIVAENHASSAADKNGDGVADRAGFSVTVLSNDKKGIELGFWTDSIWAQNDGVAEPPPNTNTLFTRGESKTFNTKQLTSYELRILGNTYGLFKVGDSTAILTGNLRDYTSFVPAAFLPSNPYQTPNFLFFGDGTPTASATFQLGAISITTGISLAPLEVDQNTDLFVKGISINDVDAGSGNITVTLRANNGILTLNNSVTNGVTGTDVSGNGTDTVTINSTISKINTTLADANGLKYRSNASFDGNDTLKVTANDSSTPISQNLNIKANRIPNQYAISTNTPTITEGNNGFQTVTFTVTRSGNLNVESSIKYAFDANNTATFGSDFRNIFVRSGEFAASYPPIKEFVEAGLSGTLNFQVGEKTKTITVDVLGDQVFERDENITIKIKDAPVGDTITKDIATVVIKNDDLFPSMRISDTSVVEGNFGLITNGKFDVRLSKPSYQQVVVNYSTNYGQTNSSDFHLFPGVGALVFQPGETVKTISFGVRGDSTVESNEKFYVNLFGATNATIAKNQGVGTIINDDSRSLFSSFFF